MKNRIMKALPMIAVLVCAVVLSGCSQAKKGSLYVASGDKSEIVTVVEMRGIRRCTVAKETHAFATRETYFDVYVGGGSSERTLLTQVVHDGRACSANAGYDFIRDDPKEAGWTELAPGSPEWLKALKALCQSAHTQPDDLRRLCEAQ